MTTIAAWVSLFLGLIGCLSAAAALMRRPGSIDKLSVWFLGFALPGSEVSALLATVGVVLAAAAWALGVDAHPVGVVALLLHALAIAGLLLAIWHARSTAGAIDSALRGTLGADYRRGVSPTRMSLIRRKLDPAHWWRPVSFGHPEVEWKRDIPYTPNAHKQQHLDVFVARAAAPGPRPVLLNIHGGGWMIGNKGTQAMPMQMHMARNGWLVFDADYRLSPGARMPDHLIDVKRAIAWVRENAATFGGDPRFIVLTGGSAGGHLTALAALTANQPQWQPGFENADTRVQAAVPFYPKVDLTQERVPDAAFEGYLAESVMPGPKADHLALWRAMTPATHLGSVAAGVHPPFFVLHGTHDELIPIDEVRWFVDQLRRQLGNEVVYAELPYAHHGFDVFHSLRADLLVEAMQHYLEIQYARWCEREGVQPTPAVGAARSLPAEPQQLAA